MLEVLEVAAHAMYTCAAAGRRQVEGPKGGVGVGKIGQGRTWASLSAILTKGAWKLAGGSW